jgi:hypothetical protein
MDGGADPQSLYGYPFVQALTPPDDVCFSNMLNWKPLTYGIRTRSNDAFENVHSTE